MTEIEDFPFFSRGYIMSKSKRTKEQIESDIKYCEYCKSSSIRTYDSKIKELREELSALSKPPQYLCYSPKAAQQYGYVLYQTKD